ncbi:hypothetical protein RvY_10753 [Ramazzottius varieornatus]|uniref:Uncharacterized protein n=1 Tax=Ramazzottius varieornatus TaxID=947166 RepID=A0A1D1VDU8_RAMVA|nr:hypothetical protein RvY_10753 [Ramazzottius varieornatus]
MSYGKGGIFTNQKQVPHETETKVPVQRKAVVINYMPEKAFRRMLSNVHHAFPINVMVGGPHYAIELTNVWMINVSHLQTQFNRRSFCNVAGYHRENKTVSATIVTKGSAEGSSKIQQAAVPKSADLTAV